MWEPPARVDPPAAVGVEWASFRTGDGLANGDDVISLRRFDARFSSEPPHFVARRRWRFWAKDPIQETWADERTCPALTTRLALLKGIQAEAVVPAAQPAATPPPSSKPSLMDLGPLELTLHVLWPSQGPYADGTITLSDGGQGAVAAWISGTRKALQPCWRPTLAEASPH